MCGSYYYLYCADHRQDTGANGCFLGRWISRGYCCSHTHVSYCCSPDVCKSEGLYPYEKTFFVAFVSWESVATFCLPWQKTLLLQKLLLLTGATSVGTNLMRRREKVDAFCEAIRALDATGSSFTFICGSVFCHMFEGKVLKCHCSWQ